MPNSPNTQTVRQLPHETGSPRNRQTLGSGFTLLEIVLAMVLSATVMYLLTMAIEMYLMRVDASRAQTETAQLARTILKRVADDVQATRYMTPPRTISGPTGSASGGDFPGGADEEGSAESDDGSGSGDVAGSAGGPTGGTAGGQVGGQVGGTSGAALSSNSTTAVLGLYGNEQQLRLDRTPVRDWQRSSMTPEQLLDAPPLMNLAQTVQYFFLDGERLSAVELAKRAMGEKPLEGIAGLYRHAEPSSGLDPEFENTLGSIEKLESAALLAPEVVKLEFAYHDGTGFVDEWDSAESRRLPAGIEIRLTLLKADYSDPREAPAEDKQRYSEKETVEFRRFVSMSPLRAQPDTQFLGGPPQQMPGGVGAGMGRSGSDGGLTGDDESAEGDSEEQEEADDE